MVAAIVLVRAAAGDPSFAVEPDYYAKSLAWDEELRQRAANERLGWRFEARTDARGARRLLVSVQLLDTAGRVVDAERIELEAFPVARASHVSLLALRLDERGDWVAELPLTHGGLWELRLEAFSAGERFTQVLRESVEATGVR